MLETVNEEVCHTSDDDSNSKGIYTKETPVTEDLGNEVVMNYKAEKVFEWLSNRLNVQESFLYIIIDKAGVKIEDFISSSLSKDKLSTIADYLGLSDEEKKCLINDFITYLHTL